MIEFNLRLRDNRIIKNLVTLYRKNEKNKFIVHPKKDKLNKIIKCGHCVETIDFIQRQTNNSQFAVISKNYFRKPYLFFSPMSETTYYK